MLFSHHLIFLFEFFVSTFYYSEKKLIYFHHNDFLDKNPNNKITRIPINPFTNQSPEELRKVTNYKAVIWANTRPLYLILSSLGITVGANPKQNVLFSDMYGWVSKASGEEARQHTL